MTPSELFALWVLDDEDDRVDLLDPADFASSLAQPDDETPTLRSIPHAGRVPCFTEGLAAEVPEVRYDLEHATSSALYHAGRGFSVQYQVYYDLDSHDSDALCEARMELCQWADRLGRR